MKSATSFAWAVLALLGAVAALATSITGSVDPGVVGEEVGGVVLEATPGGLAWQIGIRPGQRVALLHRAEERGGWALETIDAAGSRRGISAASIEGPIRATVPLAIAAVVVAALAIASVRRSARRAELVAAVALLLAGPTFGVAPASVGGALVLFLAAMGPAVWLARWKLGSSRRAIAAVAAFAAISLAALGASLSLPLGMAAVTQTWAVAVAVLALAMVGAGMGLTRSRLLHVLESVRVLDVTVLVAAAAATTGLAAVGLHPAVIVVVVGLPLLGYGRARTAIATLLDRALLSELREREAIRATEEERARVSREIHDDPLQAIAGVIQRLEDPEPDAAAARDSLRSVAARLRGVATELHPPVLDDLGLVPAIEAGARQVTRVAVVLRIDNRTGYTSAERPPPDVELAVYRIVQEAVLNAERHSGGREVLVSGSVAPHRIALEVVDDGAGISDAAIDAAMRAGHLGVSSMRRRAAAIGARLELRALDVGGTSVSFRWPE
jgi:signal transduction histidine kinase